MTIYGKPLRAIGTRIPGLTLWDVPVHGDNRGWFKENWQREKMLAAGLPDFRPVQNNVSYNDLVGTTRGIHAEPWDKLISVASGRIFGAWVDLRAGPTFGEVFTAEVDPSRAVFVPRGVGNAFQTLEANTVYTYLVNDHYSTSTPYTSINVADETVAIKWPVPLEQAELSEKDRAHPRLADVTPLAPRRLLVVGANGQLGHALRETYRDSTSIEFADRTQLDLLNPDIVTARRWQDYHAIINAAAYTRVDEAETRAGREAAWATNVRGVASLARVATEYGLALIHISSDYVFDGSTVRPYREEDPMSPLGVYGQTKAAGDHIAANVPRHYIVRTSWVVGEGQNFIRAMMSLAERGVDPRVVNDQKGRLTFASDLARAVRHLIDNGAPFGTYNVTGSGSAMTWTDIAQRVFEITGHDPERVTGVSSETYFRAVRGPTAPRPRNSMLDLSKIMSTGYRPTNSADLLAEFCRHPG